MTPFPLLTIAHRGASAHAPENTLAALRATVELGCDFAEVDVQRTRDGVLVLLHDTDLRRTAGLARAVGDLTYLQLLDLEAGSWFSPAYDGERIPTLDQALNVLAGSGTGLLLEIKHPARHPGIARDIARTLANHADPVVVQSFDHGVMRDFARRAPDVPVGLLGHPPARRLRALATWADYVNPHHRRATQKYVDAVHAASMKCFLWTIDRDDDLRRAIRLGVDGIISNRPDALHRVMSGQLVPA